MGNGLENSTGDLLIPVPLTTQKKRPQLTREETSKFTPFKFHYLAKTISRKVGFEITKWVSTRGDHQLN